MNGYEKCIARKRRQAFASSLPETILGLGLIVISVAGFAGLCFMAGA